jgi:hypothetical protein
MISGSSSSSFEPHQVKKWNNHTLRPYEHHVGDPVDGARAASDKALVLLLLPQSSSLLLKHVEGAGEPFPWLVVLCWIGQLGENDAHTLPMGVISFYISMHSAIGGPTCQLCVCAPNQGILRSSWFCQLVATAAAGLFGLALKINQQNILRKL